MLEEEITRIPRLRNIGRALAEFSLSQFPGLQLQGDSQGRFVSRPHNFVTFKVHWKRAENITITLRGNPQEFPTLPELELKSDQHGYSSCKVTKAAELAAAALYIRRAAELYREGRQRDQRRQRLVDK